MKSKMPEEEEVVLGDNLEQLLFEINEFCSPSNVKQDEIPSALDNYLKYVAKTGDTVFPWQHVRPLFRLKMLSAINNFTGEICANEAFVLERFDLFRAAPFTIQRFAELVTQPSRHYKLKEKFLRGLEKTVLVVTTVQPKAATTGGSSHSSGDSMVDPEEEDSSTDDTMVWTSHSSDGDTCVTSHPITTTTTAVLNANTNANANKTHITNTNEETGATELSSSSAPSVPPVVTSELSLHQVVTTTTGNTTTHHPVESHEENESPLSRLEQQASNAHTANASAEQITAIPTPTPTTASLVEAPIVETEEGISDTEMPSAVVDGSTSLSSLEKISELDTAGASVAVAAAETFDIDPTLTTLPLDNVTDEIPAVGGVGADANDDNTVTATLSSAPVQAETGNLNLTPTSETPLDILVTPESGTPTPSSLESEAVVDTQLAQSQKVTSEPSLSSGSSVDIDTSRTTDTDGLDPEPAKRAKIDDEITEAIKSDVENVLTSLPETATVAATATPTVTLEAENLNAPDSAQVEEADLINMDSMEEDVDAASTVSGDIATAEITNTSSETPLAEISSASGSTDIIPDTIGEQQSEQIPQVDADPVSAIGVSEPMEQDEASEAPSVPPEAVDSIPVVPS